MNTKINKAYEDIAAYIRNYCKTNNLTLRNGINMNYSSTDMDFKFSLSLNEENGEMKFNAAKNSHIRYECMTSSDKYVPEKCLGETAYTTDGRRVKIIDYVSKNRKYPIIVESFDGTKLKCSGRSLTFKK